MCSPVSYMVYGREVGESKTPHLQGYLQLSQRSTVGKVRAFLPGAHISGARGSYQQNFDYCTKDGDFVVQGVPSLTANESRKRSCEESCSDIVQLHKKKKCLLSIKEKYSRHINAFALPAVPWVLKFSIFMGLLVLGKLSLLRRSYRRLLSRGILNHPAAIGGPAIEELVLHAQ